MVMLFMIHYWRNNSPGRVISFSCPIQLDCKLYSQFTSDPVVKEVDQPENKLSNYKVKGVTLSGEPIERTINWMCIWMLHAPGGNTTPNER